MYPILAFFSSVMGPPRMDTVSRSGLMIQHNADSSGLPGSIRTQQSEDLAALHIEGDISNSLSIA